MRRSDVSFGAGPGAGAGADVATALTPHAVTAAIVVIRRTQLRVAGRSLLVCGVVGARSVVEILESHGRGESIAPADIRAVFAGWASGVVDDIQIAAICTALAGRPSGSPDVGALAGVLVASGERLELASLGPVGEIITTGCAGDSLALVACPVAATLGVMVTASADSGLGWLGGLADKLDAVPGYAVDATLGGFVRSLKTGGIAVSRRSGRILPAEARLRDLAESIGALGAPTVVAAAAAAKAIAGGASAVAFAAMHGAGAFLADADAAETVTRAFCDALEPWGRAIVTTTIDCEQPLGLMIGTSLEIRGAGEVLRGSGAGDLRERAAELAGRLAEALGVVETGTGLDAARAALDGGTALRTAERWVESHRGDPAVWSDPRVGSSAPILLAVPAPGDGVVTALDGRAVAEAARSVGAARMHPAQVIDHAVGVALVAKVGDHVVRDEPVAFVHARNQELGERAVERIEAGFRVDAAGAQGPPRA